IIVKKDTVEYQASSFKTTDNDMLEDLLKKLPGVEVSSDGTVTANGKTISKITIDGKTFFLNDPQLATKNIPAKIVEKVKVLEKKSDEAEFTGINDGNEETVIDLSVMKGMMNGWFGDVAAGGGYDLRNAVSDEESAIANQSTISNKPRFQASGIVARFTEDTQLSFVGNANNTNNRGFADMAGSMMSGMRGGRGMGGMGGGMGGGGGGGFFNVAPERVGQFKVPTVCLEHGKRDPRPAIPYVIRPIEDFTDRPAVHSLCQMLGSGQLDQRAAQVAAWMLQCDMNWQELAAKRLRFANGTSRPYFSPLEIRGGVQLATMAVKQAEQQQDTSPGAEQAAQAN
ncbi:MAG: hypothetical protein RBS80_18025, partial [Thermoguttaceae bacterium]|nr:hypothetical protein [Thermoguttaceae bacterium]